LWDWWYSSRRQEYIQSLGFTGETSINAQPVDLVADAFLMTRRFSIP
jgi:hypothetical protein